MGQDTRELWSKRVERWKDSGLSARDFASEMGINPHTLSYWRWKLGQKAAKSPSRRKRRKPVGFIEVVAETDALVGPRQEGPAVVPERSRDERPEPAELLEVILRDDVRIRVPVHFDAETLRRVVATLGAC